MVSPQTNIVRVNGQRSVLLTVQKAGNASTLNVISGIKALLPQIKTTVPAQLQIAPLSDQSMFVRGAISGVVRENSDRGVSDPFMILTFLGRWRVAMITVLLLDQIAEVGCLYNAHSCRGTQM